MAEAENALYVFGGFVNGKRMNDLYSFSCESKRWELLSEFHDVDEFSPEEKRIKYPVPR